MVNYVIRLLLVGLVVYLSPKLLGGIFVDSVSTGIVVAFVMSLLNSFVKPVLQVLAIPITFITLGLFSLVISVIVVSICDWMVDGFEISGFFTKLIFSFIVSIVNSFVTSKSK